MGSIAAVRRKKESKWNHQVVHNKKNKCT